MSQNLEKRHGAQQRSNPHSSSKRFGPNETAFYESDEIFEILQEKEEDEDQANQDANQANQNRIINSDFQNDQGMMAVDTESHVSSRLNRLEKKISGIRNQHVRDQQLNEEQRVRDQESNENDRMYIYQLLQRTAEETRDMTRAVMNRVNELGEKANGTPMANNTQGRLESISI
jgi:hypothetical protein